MTIELARETATPLSSSAYGPEMLRRELLGIVTALIVARPLVTGEDPGRLSTGTGATGITLTFIWLLAAVGWTAWRAWSRDDTWRWTAVQGALLALVGCAFLSSAVNAGYKHPAWLISWEWLAVLIAFCLVRQLPRSQGENRALLAALLATGVCLAVQAGYQAFQPESPKAIDPTVAEIFDRDARTPGQEQNRFGAWGTTLAMGWDHFWLGVGPGNFGRVYPRYLTSAAAEKVTNPSNFLLEMFATCGVLGLAALLVAAIAFFRRVGSGLSTLPKAAQEETQPTAEHRQRSNVEFYLGGVAGLTLAFFMRAGELAGHDLVVELVMYGVRAVVWLTAFALLSGLPWSGRSLLLAGMLGVAALLLYLTVSSSLFYPTLAQPLWILAALTLNALPEENPSPGEGQRNWLGLWAPIPVVAMLAAAYFMLVCYPINVASASVRTARQFYALWREENEPAWRQAVKENLPDEKVLVEPKKAEEFIQQNIIRPLGRAAANDSGNAAIWVELAYWRARQWELFADLKISPNTKFVEEASTQLKRYSRAALDALKKAKTADPGGPLAYLHTELLCLRFARMMNPTDAKQYQDWAAVNLRVLVKNDPTEPRYHFFLAETLILAGDLEQWRAEAAEAVKYDEEAGPSRQHLTAEQRETIRRWYAPLPPTSK